MDISGGVEYRSIYDSIGRCTVSLRFRDLFLSGKCKKNKWLRDFQLNIMYAFLLLLFLVWIYIVCVMYISPDVFVCNYYNILLEPNGN